VEVVLEEAFDPALADGLQRAGERWSLSVLDHRRSLPHDPGQPDAGPDHGGGGPGRGEGGLARSSRITVCSSIPCKAG